MPKFYDWLYIEFAQRKHNRSEKGTEEIYHWLLFAVDCGKSNKTNFQQIAERLHKCAFFVQVMEHSKDEFGKIKLTVGILKGVDSTSECN